MIPLTLSLLSTAAAMAADQEAGGVARYRVWYWIQVPFTHLRRDYLELHRYDDLIVLEMKKGTANIGFGQRVIEHRRFLYPRIEGLGDVLGAEISTYPYPVRGGMALGATGIGLAVDIIGDLRQMGGSIESALATEYIPAAKMTLDEALDRYPHVNPRVRAGVTNLEQSHGIRTLGDLAMITERQFLQSPRIGRKTYNQLQEMLAQHHLGSSLDVFTPAVVGWVDPAGILHCPFDRRLDDPEFDVCKMEDALDEPLSDNASTVSTYLHYARGIEAARSLGMPRWSP